MADLSNKKDPMHLRKERPDYVEDEVGQGDHDGLDQSEKNPPSVGTDPEPTDTGVEKPTITLDDEKVAKAEAEGKGYAADS